MDIRKNKTKTKKNAEERIRKYHHVLTFKKRKIYP